MENFIITAILCISGLAVTVLISTAVTILFVRVGSALFENPTIENINGEDKNER